MKNLGTVTAIALAVAAATAGAQAKPSAKEGVKSSTYTKDLPDSLMREARITEAAASATALAKVPGGRIAAVEIEREGGKLIYSYDIKVPGKSGIDEVNVNAVTGDVVGKVGHESAAAEKKEAAAEGKQKSASRARAKKPPTL